ncbi:prolipoprotein diacylglyceryl transferase [Clostridium chauvoei]|uniref:Phosphatidylglycerol--prolipoprotein diacylglyceryl transferase n=2 Tax=Clostridium chauvoei TaxID=46867 RepID=S6FQ14_9CLOT|nr:prolipoprotein diacylglyceryl transferase [Clostridium chauvoei]ATD56074.1 prolipoprotein diacylglyceryl transferase [Clostridium chauvoei]ATD58565.1 prolipoprotein diacylglyceryl transferase [Clostridium chauvoei]MBX7281385.1 prolipoprotein diacylglyceryl transferase [Clostridium chauvoei]MBX7283907.1 prolipoprotein diacylglyceryl transferase [Clostridium chauvoei]MBX7286474.1 prolipoprotein diacylglyceryl transferase [Clostridium chauvoei]
MNPVAFEVFGLEIRWYGVIISLGVVAAMALTYFMAEKKKLDFEVIIDAFLWVFPFSIIGARLYYVAFEYQNYDSFMDVINIRQGGMAIHGGLIAGLIVGLIFAKVRKINFLEYVDIVMPGVILAQAIGRWGNFMNQEAHGGLVSKEFISKFPEFIQQGMYIGGQYYHPTFLYESIWNLVVCGILVYILLKRKSSESGMVLGSYMTFYSLGRFFIEGLRTDSLMFFGLRIAQIISIVGIILGLSLIIWVKKRKKTNC